MKFIEFFDRIYVINLPYRSDRRKLIEQELDAAGMPFTPGKVELFPGIRPDSAGEFKSIGHKGAFLSHLEVLKRAQVEQLRNVLVIEDDLRLFDSFRYCEELLIGQLSQINWNIVHFGYEPWRNINVLDNQSTVTLQPFSQELIGLHFYGVNGNTLAPLIQFFEAVLQRPGGHPQGGSIPPDGALNMFCQQNLAVIRLISIPRLGEQRSSRSDISSKWFDRVPILNELINAARHSGLINQIKHVLGKE